MKNKLKNIFSNWQGLAAGLIALALLLLSPIAIRAYDPTASVFDGGLLQVLLFGAVLFFFAVFCAFTALQLVFPSVNRWIDGGGFKTGWDTLTEKQKLIYTGLTLLALFAGFIACLLAVPV